VSSVLEPAGPNAVLDGPRLLVCFDCNTLTKVAPYLGPAELDKDLDRVVALHQHHEIPEYRRKGGRLFPTEQKTWDRLDVVTELRKEMIANQVWISEYRDQVGVDAVKCFRSHGSPEWPGKPCIDYKTAGKRLGGGLTVRGVDQKKRDLHGLQYLCIYCPYESTVTTQKRWDKGAYKQ
jgi:hypothetical protein